MKHPSSLSNRYVPPVSDVIEVTIEAGFQASSANQATPASDSIESWRDDTWNY